MAKLEGAGIKGNCLKLLKDYLLSRYQRCRTKVGPSSFKSVRCGVPQGSTLGPLLYIIFIKDLVNYVNVPMITLYADDTAFLAGGKDIHAICTMINNASTEFYEWCQHNKLTLDLSKTKAMMFSNKPNKLHSKIKNEKEIRIDHIILDVVNEFRYLGITLDEKLTYTSHIKMLKQLISCRTYTLKKVR